MKKSRSIFTMRENKLPRREIYKSLRKSWFKKTGNTNGELAELIGVQPQVASTYATGSDGRTPPWSAILTLCEELGFQIVLRPNEVKVERTEELV